MSATTVVVHSHTSAAVVGQIMLAVASSVVSVAVIAALRWVRRTAHALIAAADTVKTFGRQWAEAATVVEEVHLIRHEQLNRYQRDELLITVLTRIAEHLGITPPQEATTP